jgi:hypothetical protein
MSPMQRPIPWIWITALGLLLLAPGFTARLFVDVLEGFTLLLVFGPLLLAGGGFLAWQWFKSRVRVCEVCGTSSFATSQCPACGAIFEPATSPSTPHAETAPADAVIDVQVSEVTDAD